MAGTAARRLRARAHDTRRRTSSDGRWRTGGRLRGAGSPLRGGARDGAVAAALRRPRPWPRTARSRCGRWRTKSRGANGGRCGPEPDAGPGSARRAWSVHAARPGPIRRTSTPCDEWLSRRSGRTCTGLPANRAQSSPGRALARRDRSDRVSAHRWGGLAFLRRALPCCVERQADPYGGRAGTRRRSRRGARWRSRSRADGPSAGRHHDSAAAHVPDAGSGQPADRRPPDRDDDRRASRDDHDRAASRDDHDGNEAPGSRHRHEASAPAPQADGCQTRRDGTDPADAHRATTGGQNPAPEVVRGSSRPRPACPAACRARPCRARTCRGATIWTWRRPPASRPAPSARSGP